MFIARHDGPVNAQGAGPWLRLKSDVGRARSEATICLLWVPHTGAMTRITKPEFGNRHYRPVPDPHLEDVPQAWWQRLDWPVVAVVAIVFIACFWWLF